VTFTIRNKYTGAMLDPAAVFDMKEEAEKVLLILNNLFKDASFADFVVVADGD
jgi:hypothetical protein